MGFHEYVLFFHFSGLLTSYVTWKTHDSSELKFNAFWFIISRYIRLTPALVCSICLVFFLPYFGSGPIWTETIQPIVNGCEKNWWINLIYMQAFLNPEKIVSRFVKVLVHLIIQIDSSKSSVYFQRGGFQTICYSISSLYLYYFH